MLPRVQIFTQPLVSICRSLPVGQSLGALVGDLDLGARPGLGSLDRRRAVPGNLYLSPGGDRHDLRNGPRDHQDSDSASRFSGAKVEQTTTV